MWFFSTSAKSRADKARVAVEHTKRDFQECNRLLTKMDHQLKDVESKLSPHAPGGPLKNLQRTTELTERHADQMLRHLRRMEDHIKNLETAVQNRPIHPK